MQTIVTDVCVVVFFDRLLAFTVRFAHPTPHTCYVHPSSTCDADDDTVGDDNGSGGSGAATATMAATSIVAITVASIAPSIGLGDEYDGYNIGVVSVLISG